MAYTVPTVEPEQAVAGDSVQWNRTVSAFPPSGGWELSYSLTGAHESVLSITASASDDGDYYEVRVTPAASVQWTEGPYTLYGHVTDGTDRHKVYEGPLFVAADPATATPTLSHAEKTFAILEAKIEGRATADIDSYEIEGQRVDRIPMPELLELRNVYAEKVRRERGGRMFQNVGVSFGAAS